MKQVSWIGNYYGGLWVYRCPTTGLHYMDIENYTEAYEEGGTPSDLEGWAIIPEALYKMLIALPTSETKAQDLALKEALEEAKTPEPLTLGDEGSEFYLHSSAKDGTLYATSVATGIIHMCQPAVRSEALFKYKGHYYTTV